MATVDARPSFPRALKIIERSGLIVIGKTRQISKELDSTYLFTAPRVPTYTVEELGDIHTGLLKRKFRSTGIPHENKDFLYIGGVGMDLSNGRLFVNTYPDEEIATERFKWSRAWNRGRGPQLRNVYVAQGIRMPMNSVVRLSEITQKRFKELWEREWCKAA